MAAIRIDAAGSLPLAFYSLSLVARVPRGAARAPCLASPTQRSRFVEALGGLRRNLACESAENVCSSGPDQIPTSGFFHRGGTSNDRDRHAVNLAHHEFGGHLHMLGR